ncbi:hypothetical protein COLO4_15694 [Corchorus olitorius]|uniref:Uncharacterized protein n=1 Tax=Corchorus olitorius TaxID=93759 RepID=A0A1R3JLL0_9ROSI|nr:hypothetical protein COLO4_15694 [Corchorus olitorius]
MAAKKSEESAARWIKTAVMVKRVARVRVG